MFHSAVHQVVVLATLTVMHACTHPLHLTSAMRRCPAAATAAADDDDDDADDFDDCIAAWTGPLTCSRM
jgi:hypothetical protein